MKKITDTPTLSDVKVIGHPDGVHACESMVLYRVALESWSKTIAFVWNAKQNVLLTDIVDYDDPTFAAWRSAHAAVSSSNLFPSLTRCGTEWSVYFPTPVYSSEFDYSTPAGCPSLFPPGTVDTYKCTAGSGLTLNVFINAVVLPLSGGVMVGLYPESACCTSPVPASHVNGYHTQRKYDYTFWVAEGGLSWGGSFTDTYTFSYPLGDFEVVTLGSGSVQLGDPVIEDDHFRRISDTAYVPYYNGLFGKYSKNILSTVAITQYVLEHWEFHTGYEAPNIYYDPRTSLIHAQAIYDSSGVADKDWVAEGRNAALEAKISDALAATYILNGLTANNIAACHVSISII